MWAMNNIDLPDADSPRPNLANIPSMDDMLALYEKVLAELDSAISTQKTFRLMTSNQMPVTAK
jgi:hypothetical protein